MSSFTTAQLQPNALYGTGGNSADIPFQDSGFASTSFIILSGAIVMMMTPFVGLLYSGLSTTRNGLSSFLICMITYSVVALQWFLWGYSIAFSEEAYNGFIGNLDHGGFKGILNQKLALSAPAIPAIVFAFFQLQVCTLTAAITFGSVVERIRFAPSAIFIFFWATFVYCPMAYWTWGARGWLKNISCLSTISPGQTPCHIGVYDFAGGGPVEICTGASALALTLIVGKRKRIGQAHNLVNVNIATGLLWFGWFAYNSGSGFSASPRAAMAAMTTNLAGVASSLAWITLDYIRTGKISSLGFCAGALAGLVVITPGCGFVQPWAAVIIGACGGLFSNCLCRYKTYFGYDDTMDAFGIHGGPGFLGLILTGVFADSSIAAMDGTVIPGGAINGHSIQIGYQVISAVVCLVYAFTVTYSLAWCFSKVPFLSLRSAEAVETKGLDQGELGEKGYQYSMANGLDNIGDGDK